MFKAICALAFLTLIATFPVDAAQDKDSIHYPVKAEVEERSIPEYESAKTYFSQVHKSLKLPSNPTVVLLGWDTGKTSDYIAHEIKDAKVVNFNLNADLKDFAEKNYPHDRIVARHGDITLPQTELAASADFIFSSWVVGLIPEHKQAESLANMRNMLKPNGTCAVLFPMKGSTFSKAIETIAGKPEWKSKFETKPVSKRASYTPDQYAAMMKAAGFKNVNATKQIYTMNFTSRAELETFVHTGISRYLSYLNPAETQQFIVAVADEYVRAVSAKSGASIPYSVDMMLAVGVR